ncbi:hypothetical protein ABW20_dc0100624 [Dactylellina cionopaga]|nr:hypothetical protein ABW20_dc0100624 [Dactylellina cionopaga]
MSARQRHSRVPTSDGWTTISSPSRKKGSKKSTAAGGQSALLAHKSDLEPLSSTEYADGVLELIENLDGRRVNESDDGGKEDIDEEREKEILKVKTRLERQIGAFNASDCCEELKEVLRKEMVDDIPGDTIGSTSDSANPKDENSGRQEMKDERDVIGVSTAALVATKEDRKNTRTTNFLILALGSISESFTAAPGYQLAAALAIIDVLRNAQRPVDLNNVPAISTNNEEWSEVKEAEKMQILSYDPVYTVNDIHILHSYGITPTPANKIPLSTTWYENAVVYMPHASIWLNHKYFMLRPKVWIGNSFQVYETVAFEKGDNNDDDRRADSKGDNRDEKSQFMVMIEEVQNVMEREGYVKVQWPDETFGGGAVFNNLVIYVRKRDGRRKERDNGWEQEVHQLTKELNGVNLESY